MSPSDPNSAVSKGWLEETSTHAGGFSDYSRAGREARVSAPVYGLPPPTFGPR